MIILLFGSLTLEIYNEYEMKLEDQHQKLYYLFIMNDVLLYITIVVVQFTELYIQCNRLRWRLFKSRAGRYNYRTVYLIFCVGAIITLILHIGLIVFTFSYLRENQLELQSGFQNFYLTTPIDVLILLQMIWILRKIVNSSQKLTRQKLMNSSDKSVSLGPELDLQECNYNEIMKSSIRSLQNSNNEQICNGCGDVTKYGQQLIVFPCKCIRHKSCLNMDIFQNGGRTPNIEFIEFIEFMILFIYNLLIEILIKTQFPNLYSRNLMNKSILAQILMIIINLITIVLELVYQFEYMDHSNINIVIADYIDYALYSLSLLIQVDELIFKVKKYRRKLFDPHVERYKHKWIKILLCIICFALMVAHFIFKYLNLNTNSIYTTINLIDTTIVDFLISIQLIWIIVDIWKSRTEEEERMIISALLGPQVVYQNESSSLQKKNASIQETFLSKPNRISVMYAIKNLKEKRRYLYSYVDIYFIRRHALLRKLVLISAQNA
ncbi:hypothetical protein pb186bvf_012044 [Paramecium bursaria]